MILVFLTPNPGRWVVKADRRAPFPETISILVSARNEESRVLSQAIRSMLDQDYPPLELIAVDDRSTDRTLQILQSIGDPRLRIVEGRELPPDWVGKPHGLSQAEPLARGDWIIVTDADIIFEPAALATALHLCQQNGWDVLSLWPKIECHTFWERVVMPVDLAVTAMLFPIDRVNGSRHRDAFTIGGFTLLRRSALTAIGGFRALHKDVADDFALGILVKQAGYRLHMGFAPELLKTRDYVGLNEIWEGLTRKLFSNFIYIPFVRAFRQKFREIERWRRRHRRVFLSVVGGGALLAGVGGLALTLLPALGLGFSPLPALLGFALSAWIHRQYARLIEVDWEYSLLAPVGYAIYACILLMAAGRVLSGRGLTWRGRRIY